MVLSTARCPECGGGPLRLACKRCRGWGTDVLIECPLKVIGRADKPAIAAGGEGTFEILAAADLAKGGHWPRAGGWLEQSAGLVAAARAVWSECGRYEDSQ